MLYAISVYFVLLWLQEAQYWDMCMISDVRIAEVSCHGNQLV